MYDVLHATNKYCIIVVNDQYCCDDVLCCGPDVWGVWCKLFVTMSTLIFVATTCIIVPLVLDSSLYNSQHIYIIIAMNDSTCVQKTMEIVRTCGKLFVALTAGFLIITF